MSFVREMAIVGEYEPVVGPWLDELIDVIESQAMGVGVQAYAATASGVLADIAVGSDGLGRPIVPASLSALHCAGKPLTSIAVHQMAEAGLLVLGAPLAEYLPDLRSEHLRRLTCAHLLTHTAGLYKYQAVQFEQIPSDEHDSAMCAAEPDVSAIGAPVYSEFGAWHLLGMVIRAVAGRGVREMVRTDITEPLRISDDLLVGVDSVDFDGVRTRLAPNCVILRDRITPLLLNCTERLVTSERAANGTYGNARSLGTLYRHLGSVYSGAVADGGIIASSTLHHMVADRTETKWDLVMRRPCSYGVGIMVDLSNHLFGTPLGTNSFGHSGYRGSSFAFHDPDLGLTVAVQQFGIVPGELAFLRRERSIETLTACLAAH